jgi:pilus assembly protein Flp/PilA
MENGSDTSRLDLPPPDIDPVRAITGEVTMRFVISSLLEKVQLPLLREEGQDLVEYALIVALISLAAVVGMQALAGDINSAFSNVGSQLSTAV